MSDIAVLHGNYFARGGGERVADAIAEAFDAPLYYGFGDEDAIPDDDIDRIKLFKPTKIGRGLVRRLHQYRDFRFMWNGQHLPELADYDVVVQSGNEFGWYVPKDDQAIVKYVHSTPRGPYDMFHKFGHIRKHRLYCLAVKTLYRHTTSYPDIYAANSEVVAGRCRKYWGEDARVVYPPVSVGEFGQEWCETPRESTYLALSRLYRHKRMREIVQAFDGRDARLIVAGDGPQRDHLEEIAPENVTVEGYVDEARKRRLLAECRALLFNAENEDFGMVAVEAMASGTPVIGVRDGFTQFQIRDGLNGYLFDKAGRPADIAQAIGRFESQGVEWSASELERFAEQFSRERFEEELRTAVRDALSEVDVDSAVSFDLGEVRA